MPVRRVAPQGGRGEAAWVWAMAAQHAQASEPGALHTGPGISLPVK